MDPNPLTGLIALIKETGFVLFFAIYSLLRHDNTLKELTKSIIELREMLRDKTRQ